MRLLRTSVVAAAVSAAAVSMSSRSEAAPNHLGETGHVMISADRLMSLFAYTATSETFTAGNVTATRTISGPGFSLLFAGNRARDSVHNAPRLALDFPISNFTIGGAVAVAFGAGGKQEDKANGNTTLSVDRPTTTVFGFAPRAGYILHLGDSFAFWPRLGVAYYNTSYKETKGPQQPNGPNVVVTDSTSAFSIDVDPEFVFVPWEHVGLTAGLLFNIPVAGTHKTETEEGSTARSTSNDHSAFNFGVVLGMMIYF